MPDLMQGASPASYLADLTGWGDFDSLVLTGFGVLGHLFPDSYGASQEATAYGNWRD